MADKENVSEFEEEEFDFDHDEHSANQAPTPPKKKSALPLILGGIAGIVVLWQVYHLLPKKPSSALPNIKAETASSGGDHMAPPPAPPLLAQKIETKADNKALPLAPPTVPAIPENTVTSAQIQDLKEVLSRLESQGREQQQRVQFLEQGLRQLTAQFGQVNQTLSMQNKDLSAIQGMIQTTAKEVHTLLTPPPKAEAPAEKKSAAIAPELMSAPRLSVHAIIPGRAWLKNKEGRTITVTEGDQLEAYGKVLVIDPKAGVVITSSGVALR